MTKAEEKYKAMLEEVRISSRLQDQHIKDLEAEKETWKAREKEFKAREAQFKDTIKKQEQVINQQKEIIKEKNDTISSMTESCEKFKKELERMRSFITKNVAEKDAKLKESNERVEVLESGVAGLIQEYNDLAGELKNRTATVQHLNLLIDRLNQEAAEFKENLSSQQQSQRSIAKSRSTSSRHKLFQPRQDLYVQQSILSSLNLQKPNQRESDSSQDSKTSTKRRLEHDEIEQELNYNQRRMSQSSIRSFQRSLPNSPRISTYISPILSSVSLGNSPNNNNSSQRFSSQLSESKVEEEKSDGQLTPIQFTLPQELTEQSESSPPIVDISSTVSSQLSTQPIVDISSTIPSQQSTQPIVDIPSINDNTMTIKGEEEPEEEIADFTSLLASTIPPTVNPSLSYARNTRQPLENATPSRQPLGNATPSRQPLGNATNTRKPLGNATNMRKPLGDASNSKAKTTKHNHGDGMTCLACNKFYDTDPLRDVENDNTSLDTRERIQLHSKHRGRNNGRAVTPPGFWDPDFTFSSPPQKN